MQRIQQLRALSERVVGATLASFTRRAAPVSGHQAAADFYDAVDAYTDAVLKNNSSKAKDAAERLAVEAMRVLYSYQSPAVPFGVDDVHVESKRATETVEA